MSNIGLCLDICGYELVNVCQFIFVCLCTHSLHTHTRVCACVHMYIYIYLSLCNIMDMVISFLIFVYDLVSEEIVITDTSK